jgi:ubiquinone/menaquinone biosynthesis C-methylase UbiE
MHTNEQIDPALFRDSERTAHDRIASSYQAFCVPITANAAMQLLDAVRASVGMHLLDVATGRGVIRRTQPARELASQGSLVVCAFGMGHFPRRTIAMRECSRVLTPGGQFAVAWWDVPDRNAFSVSS